MATTPDEIEEQVYADAKEGVARFSDGTNSVEMIDLRQRLAIARQARQETAATGVAFGLRTTKLQGQGPFG